MNIYEKIHQVMQDIQYLQKDGFVETGNGRGYKAMTDEKVASTLRPALLKARLIILPIDMDTARIDEEIVDRGGNIKKNRITDCKVRYRIFDIDNPSDFVDVVSSGTGVDTQDKGIGKAMTYARKYMLLNAFLIPTGNDTDDISSDMYDAQLYGKDAERKVTPEQVREEILTIADQQGIPREKLTTLPYKDYGDKLFADLELAELYSLKRRLLS